MPGYGMGESHDGEESAMGNSETPANYPETEAGRTDDLNAALVVGDLNGIMSTLGQMARAHRMRRVAQETGLGLKSLYMSLRAGVSPEFATVLKVTRTLDFRLQVHPTADSSAE